MRYSVRELQDEKTWPREEVWFIPFVGQHYDQGVDGLHVLILGESHYAADTSNLAIQEGGERGLTQSEFRDCELNDKPGSRAWGSFFRRLDNIVTQQLAPDEATAAEKWKHVVYANFVQKPVGSAARIRPDPRGWDSGRRAFPVLLQRLSPDIVLVLGRDNFNHTPDEPGERIDEIKVNSSTVGRSLWRMTYDGGSTLMSWVYHPSWPNDKPETYIDVFKELLERARRKLPPPDRSWY